MVVKTSNDGRTVDLVVIFTYIYRSVLSGPPLGIERRASVAAMNITATSITGVRGERGSPAGTAATPSGGW
jgi:hypothetical protein